MKLPAIHRFSVTYDETVEQEIKNFGPDISIIGTLGFVRESLDSLNCGFQGSTIPRKLITIWEKQ